MKLYIIVQMGPLAGKAFSVSGGEIIGREKGDIILSDPKVSGKHAIVKKSLRGRLYLQDQKSKNGIKVKGKRVDKVNLEVGSSFQIGANSFVVSDKSPSKSKQPAKPVTAKMPEASTTDRIVEAPPEPAPNLQQMKIECSGLSGIPAIQEMADEFSKSKQPAFPNEDNNDNDDSTGPLTDLSEIREKMTRTDHINDPLTDDSLLKEISAEELGNEDSLDPDSSLDQSIRFNSDGSINENIDDLEHTNASTQLINDVLSALDDLDSENAALKTKSAAVHQTDSTPPAPQPDATPDAPENQTQPQTIKIDQTILIEEDSSPNASYDDNPTLSQSSLDPGLPVDESSLKFNTDPSSESFDSSSVESKELSFSDETIVSPAEGSQPSAKQPLKAKLEPEQTAKPPSAVSAGEVRKSTAKPAANSKTSDKAQVAPEQSHELSLDDEDLSLSGLGSGVKGSDVFEDDAESKSHKGPPVRSKDQPEEDEPHENSKAGASISLRTLDEKKQFEIHNQNKERRQRWNHILESFSRDSVRGVNSSPKKLEPFHSALKLTFYKGIQAETEWLIGYGPRFVGKKSLDLTLIDEKAPGDISFSFHPHGETAIFRTPFPKEVKINGSSLSEAEVQSGDVITVNQTEIEIEILK
jgi:pSer/pThr/pTyr-binding forkhead associated (FHA) protein